MFKIKSYQEHRMKSFLLTLICVSSNISSLWKFYEFINHCISPFVIYLSFLLFFSMTCSCFLFEYKYCVSSVHVNIPFQTAFSLFLFTTKLEIFSMFVGHLYITYLEVSVWVFYLFSLNIYVFLLLKLKPYLHNQSEFFLRHMYKYFSSPISSTDFPNLCFDYYSLERKFLL